MQQRRKVKGEEKKRRAAITGLPITSARNRRKLRMGKIATRIMVCVCMWGPSFEVDEEIVEHELERVLFCSFSRRVSDILRNSRTVFFWEREFLGGSQCGYILEFWERVKRLWIGCDECVCGVCADLRQLRQFYIVKYFLRIIYQKYIENKEHRIPRCEIKYLERLYIANERARNYYISSRTFYHIICANLPKSATKP